MGQFRKMLASLSLSQKLTTVVVVLLVAGGFYSFVHWRKESDFKPLYTGLAVEDSAAVVQKLKEAGAEYRLSDTGDAISVPSAKLAELRLDMAAAGLPKTGRIGFEIFDKANLGATEFVEHINYRRALEGELERSVTALAEVEQARVHITFPKDSVFLESREPAKASVLVKLRPGVRLSPRNVMAITHLVGSAVEDLLPDAVSVLDMQGNLLSQPVHAGEEDSEAALDYRQKVEHDLVQKISATLDPLLGHERYRAGVSVDCDITSGEQSEETVDPARSVMLSSQKTEDVTTGSGTSGVPGTASNLPRPTSRPGSSAGNSTTRRTESVAYEASRTIRKTKLPQGALKRLFVSVLLDHTATWEGSGKSAHKVLTPPSPETVKSVRDLVATVVGFSQDRGDQITIESLPFEATMNQPPPEPPSPAAPTPQPPPKWNDWKKQPLFLPIAGGIALLLLLVVAAVFLSRGRKKKAEPELTRDLPAGAPPGARVAGALEAGAVSAGDQMQAQLEQRAAQQEQADMAALASIKVPPVKTKKSEVLAKQLRENVKKDATTSANVLQSWIHDRG